MITTRLASLALLFVCACTSEVHRQSASTTGGTTSTSSAGSSSGSSSSTSAGSSTSGGPTGPVPVELALGGSHSCARMSDGSVRCWGAGGLGQLGNGAFDDHPAPVFVQGVQRAVKLSAGRNHTCALLDDGGVICWGGNFSGETGREPCTNAADGPCMDDATAKPALSITHATDIALGSTFSCVVHEGGTVQCWGGVEMMLGAPASTAPLTIQGVAGAVKLAAGGNHACASDANGSLQCWGDNTVGELGDGMNVDNIQTHPAPLTPINVGGTAKFALGGGTSCAIQMLKGPGPLLCWGGYTSMTLDGEGNPIDSASPAEVPGLNAVDLAVGEAHRCALASDGSVRCWGWNNRGQVGDGTQKNHWSPSVVAGIQGAKQVAAGASHSCALEADAQVLCWGDNTYGQLGDGGSEAQASTPVTVSFAAP